jgi:hypothetical protein
MNSQQEITLAIQNLRAITDMAERRNDSAIYVTSLTMETLAHLLTESSDSTINAQESIAKARSLQMHPSAAAIPKVWSMLNCIDLVCSMIQFKKNEALEKSKVVQEAIDQQISDKKIWSADDMLAVPLGKKSSEGISDCVAQIYTKDDDGIASLNLSWMNGCDAYATGFLLCGMTTIVRNATEPRAQAYINAGIEFLDGNITFSRRNIVLIFLDFMNMSETKAIQLFTGSRADVHRKLKRTSTIHHYLRLYQLLIYCIQSEWSNAQQALLNLKEQSPSRDLRHFNDFSRWLIYLEAVIQQAQGNSEVAKDLYKKAIELQPRKTGPNRRPGLVNDDISLLCHLNLPQVLDKSADRAEIETILATIVSSRTENHPNQGIRCAISLIQATQAPKEAIASTKATIQQLLVTARSNNNAQLMAIAMCTMVNLFFAGIVVGEQAKKSRRTTQILANRSAMPLWIAVADGLVLQGETDEKEKYEANRDLEAAMNKCPEEVKSRFLEE